MSEGQGNRGVELAEREFRILVVDDNRQNVDLLVDILFPRGYLVATASNGEEALKAVAAEPPDLILLDVLMPGMNGYEVCRRIKDDPSTEIIPVVLVTALDPKEERVNGMRARADDFLSKPISAPELTVRVKSLLRIKALFDQVETKTAQLESLNVRLEAFNNTLEERVQAQVGEIERLGQFQRFLSPPVARKLASSGDDGWLESHRKEIAVLFCDLRDFTGFSEVVEPEEATAVLKEYHVELDRLIDEHEGTIDHRAGDGMMVFFNDPVPCDEPASRAVSLAIAMREQVTRMRPGWSRYGRELGFGVGVAYGFATIGLIGADHRLDYAASGRPVNLASRLCDRARDGQILVNERTHVELGDAFSTESVGVIEIRGLDRPTPVFNARGFAGGSATP